MLNRSDIFISIDQTGTVRRKMWRDIVNAAAASRFPLMVAWRPSETQRARALSDTFRRLRYRCKARSRNGLRGWQVRRQPSSGKIRTD